MDEQLENNGTYAHAAAFSGIFVTYPLVPIMKKNGGILAYAPNSFFTRWEMQPERERFISPLRYILSAN